MEELDRIEEAIDGKLVTKYESIIRKSLMDLRAIGGSNPKVGLFIRSISKDVKKMSSMIKKDIKKGTKYPSSQNVALDAEAELKKLGLK